MRRIGKFTISERLYAHLSMSNTLQQVLNLMNRRDEVDVDAFIKGLIDEEQRKMDRTQSTFVDEAENEHKWSTISGYDEIERVAGTTAAFKLRECSRALFNGTKHVGPTLKKAIDFLRDNLDRAKTGHCAETSPPDDGEEELALGK